MMGQLLLGASQCWLNEQVEQKNQVQCAMVEQPSDRFKQVLKDCYIMHCI